MLGVELAEGGWLPDPVVRWGIRRMLADRLGQLAPERTDAFLARAGEEPIALVPELANEQHYEVPAAFFERALGSRLKYSCAYWPPGVDDLDTAEARMLDLTTRRAQVEDGMTVLDLGCGWGSLGLWIAERHPGCRVLAVSNSKLQAEFIRSRVDREGLRNLDVVTADVNELDLPAGRFDRVASVEMFEHVRNHGLLLARIARWLTPAGKLFVHHFCHRTHAYPYETEGSGNWMGRHFFSGGMMPSEDLLSRTPGELGVERRWRVGGLHYHRTCEAWLRNVDARPHVVLPILAGAYGERDAGLWLRRWRLFFLGCSELFRHRAGREWFVSHSLLSREAAAAEGVR